MIKPSGYDPKKVVPQEMWGRWEVVSFEADLYFQEERYSEEVKLDGEFIMHKKLLLHPKWLILDGVQYNDPHYIYKKSHWADQPKKYYLDSYNGYKLGKDKLTQADSFYIDGDGDMHFSYAHVDATCRRLPNPTLLERLKQYWTYITDSGAGDRGFRNLHDMGDKGVPLTELLAKKTGSKKGLNT